MESDWQKVTISLRTGKGVNLMSLYEILLEALEREQAAKEKVALEETVTDSTP